MRTSAVILGVQPPDVFPLVYYRENAADLQITTEDINLIDFRQFKIVEISATSLSKNPSRSSVLHAAKKAKESDCFIILDLDFRLDQWISIADYQHYMSAVAPYIDLVVGTKEEFLAAAKNAGTDITVVDQQMSNPEIVGDLEKALVYMMNLSDAKLIVKNGSQGCLLITPPESEKVVIHGFPVTVLNILGAGDAFASGLIYGLCHSWPMAKACKMANACGAIMVTKHGCANFMPTLEEVNNFVDQHGGWNESN
jgi:5-dehydro-2-deoxygluconokinase